MTFSKRQCSLTALLVLILLILVNCSGQNKKTQEKQDVFGSKTSQAIPVEIIKQQQDIPIWDSLRALSIINNHGNIFIRHTDDPFIGILSNMQLIGEIPEQGKINIHQKQTKLHISVDYPSDKEIGVNTLINGYKKGRVDLVVFVPNTISLILESTYGSINIKRISNDVNIKTHSGNVKLSGSGQTNIQTGSGDIYAYLYESNWKAASSFDSEDGNIVLTFPDINNLNMYVHSNTNKILNNFKAGVVAKNGSYVYSHHALKNTINITNKNGLINLISIKNQKVSFPSKENKI